VGNSPLLAGDAGILHMYRPDIKCFGTVQGHKGSMDFIAVHPTRTDWVLSMLIVKCILGVGNAAEKSLLSSAFETMCTKFGLG
jgi:hypothetical protein